MATVPIRIMWASITDANMWCEKHAVFVPFVSDRKATGPIDEGSYNMCPGLEATLAGEGKYWDSHQAEIEERDAEDRAQWVLIIDTEDATVTVG